MLLQLLLIYYVQITYQVVISTNSRASFVAYIYGEDGVDAVKNLQEVKLIGFDAGDTVRSATVSMEILQPVNIFRIDGKLL